MQRRVRKVVNFFAFNLLFFALYLNFIHKDPAGYIPDPRQASKNPAFSGALISNEQTAKENEGTSVANGVAVTSDISNGKALKLSIN